MLDFGGSEGRCTSCVEAPELALGRRQHILSQNTGLVSDLCPLKLHDKYLLLSIKLNIGLSTQKLPVLLDH